MAYRFEGMLVDRVGNYAEPRVHQNSEEDWEDDDNGRENELLQQQSYAIFLCFQLNLARQSVGAADSATNSDDGICKCTF